MRVLVTGGAGYLGSTLVSELLGQGHHVRALDSLMYGGGPLLGLWSHPDFEFAQADIRDRAAVERAVKDVDGVVHLAAIVGDPACARDPDVAREVNLDASRAILEAVEDSAAERLIFASTCSNYGKVPDPTQHVDETAELRPVSLYAETKVAVENELLDASSSGRTARTVLRFATLFGVSARMRFDLTVNEFTARLIREKRLMVYGEQFWRPYVHVADAARAIAMVLASNTEDTAGTVFNVGSTDQNYRKKDLVTMIRPYAPDSTVEYVNKDEDPRDYRVSFARIADTLDYRIIRSVDDGIREIAGLMNAGMIDDIDAPGHRN